MKTELLHALECAEKVIDALLLIKQNKIGADLLREINEHRALIRATIAKGEL